MTNLDECVITVPVVGGVFGVGRLATRLKALADTEQIGPWHIGQWIDFKHTAIRIRFGSFFFQAEDGIRYLIVTGVQTCALPISVSCPMRRRRQWKIFSLT